MKKLLALGMVLLLSVAFLAACDNDPTEAPPVDPTDTEVTPPTEVDPTEVDPTEEMTFGGENFTFWIDNEDYGDALMAALSDRFPDSSFSFEQVGGNYTLDRLRSDGPADIGADILLFPHDRIGSAINDNLLLPLGPTIGNAMHGRIPAAGIRTVDHAGNYFGVPLRMESVALFYNLDLLEEAGFDVPGSWEEIIEMAEEFNNPATMDFIIRWNAGDAFFNQFALTAFGFELFGPNQDDPDSVDFDNPGVVEGLEFLAGLRETVLPVPSEDLNWDTVHGAFVAGEVPLIITGPWSIPYINRESTFEWGVTTIPTIAGNQPRTFSGYHVAAVSAWTEYSDLARAVLEFMMSDEGLQIMHDNIGVLPALNDVSLINGVVGNEALLGVEAQMAFSDPMPSILEMGHFWGSAPGMHSAVWEGLLTPEAAVAQAIEDFDAARALAE